MSPALRLMLRCALVITEVFVWDQCYSMEQSLRID
jgi:hypothetical protein